MTFDLCPFDLWERQRDELAGILTSGYPDDDVLLAFDHVRHRCIAHAGRQLHLPRNLTGLLVERAELLATPRTARRQPDTAVAAFAHAGDAFANKGQPLIDRNNGGSGIAYPETIAKAAKGIKNVDVVINGHSPMTMKFEDLVNYAEFNRLFLEHAKASLKAGKTPEQAMMDLKLPDKFKDYNLAGGRGGPGGNFGVIFEELKGGSSK